jgi:hypothetical protein
VQAWALVEFDLSTILGEDITIDSATLEVYEGQVGSAGKVISCYRAKTSWNEATVIWASRPQLGPSVLDYVTTDGVIGWWVFDVAEQVQDWVDGEHVNNGFVLVHTPGCTFPYVYSSDYTGDPEMRPILRLEYSPRSAVEEISWGEVKANF